MPELYFLGDTHFERFEPLVRLYKKYSFFIYKLKSMFKLTESAIYTENKNNYYYLCNNKGLLIFIVIFFNHIFLLRDDG